MSETQKHTPTPWTAGEWITGHDGHYVYSLIFGAGKRVASVSVYGTRKDGSDAGKPARFGGTRPTYTEEEVDANRAFIVRAVNAHDQLVAALQNALSAMGRAGANADVNHPQRAAWEDARAALSKAGE
jgi:hypothetical protein